MTGEEEGSNEVLFLLPTDKTIVLLVAAVHHSCLLLMNLKGGMLPDGPHICMAFRSYSSGDS